MPLDIDVGSYFNKVGLYIRKCVNLYVMFVAGLIGIGLSVLIVAIGQAFWIKLLFYGLSFVVAAIFCGCYMEDSSLEFSEKMEKVSQVCRIAGVFIICSLLSTEAGLFYNSGYRQHIPLKVYVTDEIREVPSEDRRLLEDKSYKVVEIYEGHTNNRISKYSFPEEEFSKVDLYTDITEMEVFIDYVPFLIYGEKQRFVRESN